MIGHDDGWSFTYDRGVYRVALYVVAMMAGFLGLCALLIWALGGFA
jgi:hypothetical protein